MRRVPATVITGFLGAGKTSLVRHLLALRRRTAARARHQRVRRARHRPRDAARLRRRRLRRGRHHRARQRLHLLHRRRGFSADARTAARPRRAARAHPDRDLGPGVAEAAGAGLRLARDRTRTTVDGVMAVIDAAAVAAGRFADDPEAVALAAGGRPGARPRQSARGGVRRPARLRRSRHAQQDRSDRPGTPRRR